MPKNSSTGTTQDSNVGTNVLSMCPAYSTSNASSLLARSGSTRVVTNREVPSTGSLSSPMMRSVPISTRATFRCSRSS